MLRNRIPVFFTAALAVMMLLPGAGHQAARQDNSPIVTMAGDEGPASPAAIYFDDSLTDRLVLGNATWEVAFRKTNGGILYITDKTVGGTLSTGSHNECLWGAVSIPLAYYIGGCSFHKDWSNHFTYAWSAGTRTLTFTYHTDPVSPDQFNATVQVTAWDADFFDMRLQVQQHYADGRTFDYILFPSELIFLEADVKGVLLPMLPGVVLKPGFFSEDRMYSWKYPGYPGAFADYIGYSTLKGELAIYSIQQNDFLQPVETGIQDNDETQAGSYYVYHNYGVDLRADQAWSSPLVRFRLSKPWKDTILDYRLDNGLNTYKSIQEKLGSLYPKLIHMPEYRLVSFEVARKFSEYDSLFFTQIRTPALLHPVGFQPVGHDHYSPDYFPPDTRWCNVAANCNQEFAAMFDQAKSRGWLVMPYTNPTWWNPDGYTLQNLPNPLTVTDISVQDRAGTALYETYGPNGGYVISPYVPYVLQRLDQFMTDLTTLVPSDLIFEDQIGARAWIYDFNPSSPGSAHYMQGWIEHTLDYQDNLLTTELAFDRLAETEAGFYGSILLPQKLGQTTTNWGASNWSLYPLAQMMTRDKVLFYQHDLALETFSDSKANITWNLAMGYNMGDDLRLTEGSVHANPWLRLNGELQDHLLADYASERVVDFVTLAPTVTQTFFQTVSVVANWDTGSSYSYGGHTLAAYGVFIQDASGRLTAGILTAYNGHTLTSGDHYLIIRQGLDRISVRQPMGSDTSLTLPLPSGWQAGDAIQVRALDINGTAIGSLSLEVSPGGITFNYPMTLFTQEVEQVEIVNEDITINRVSIPMVVR